MSFRVIVDKIKKNNIQLDDNKLDGDNLKIDEDNNDVDI
jgi:hypothetical protein